MRGEGLLLEALTLAGARGMPAAWRLRTATLSFLVDGFSSLSVEKERSRYAFALLCDVSCCPAW